MKKIEDYIHFYLWCECQLFWRKQDGTVKYERNGILITIQPENKEQYGLVFKCKTDRGNFIEYAYPYSDVKPILRPLSDMSEEEKKECGNLDYDFSDEEELNKWNAEDFEVLLSANQFLWLLSKHFDLVGLIEAGLAIDKTTIK